MSKKLREIQPLLVDICIESHPKSKVIQEMLPVMDPEEDYMTIVAAEEKISSSEAARKKELEEAHAKLKGQSAPTMCSRDTSTTLVFLALSRVLEAARVSSTRPASVPSGEAHAATLNELDSANLSMAKAISDCEALLANKEAELAALKEEARRLETYDPAVEHGKELDGNLYVVSLALLHVLNADFSRLRLALYKSLGFTPIVNNNGEVTKILVRE
jgi:kinetochore protein Spc24